MNPGLWWILAGIVLCGAELVHPGVFLLWIGLAAVAAGGVIMALAPGAVGQIVLFLMLLIVSLTLAAFFRRREADGGGVNASDYGMIGRTCRVVAFEGLEGRVIFRDGTWSARMTSGPTPVTGAILRVVGLDGTTLLVAPEAADAAS